MVEDPAVRSARWQKWYKSSGRRLKERYGITAEEYQSLYDKLEGCCEICGKMYPRLDVDHYHVTGKVRGLLCRKCNLRAGFLEDAVTQRTLEYLIERGYALTQRTLEYLIERS